MTTTTHPVTRHTSSPRTARRFSLGKPLTAVLLTAGVLLGAAGAAAANTGGATSTSSIPRSVTIRVDPSLVHPDAPLIPRRQIRIAPGVVKTDCFFDVGAGLYRCP